MVDSTLQIQVSPQELLRQTPEAVYLIVQLALESGEKPNSYNAWLGVAEIARHHALSGEYIHETWAKVAIATYEYLSRVDSSTSQVKMMMFKAALFARLQTEQGLVTFEEIKTWFLSQLPYSYAEVVEKTREGKTSLLGTLPPQELRALRDLKNRIGVLTLLENTVAMQQDTTLQAWLPLGKNLP